LEIFPDGDIVRAYAACVRVDAEPSFFTYVTVA
jgi:hypothetical protein